MQRLRIKLLESRLVSWLRGRSRKSADLKLKWFYNSRSYSQNMQNYLSRFMQQLLLNSSSNNNSNNISKLSDNSLYFLWDLPIFPVLIFISIKILWFLEFKREVYNIICFVSLNKYFVWVFMWKSLPSWGMTNQLSMHCCDIWRMFDKKSRNSMGFSNCVSKIVKFNHSKLELARKKIFFSKNTHTHSIILKLNLQIIMFLQRFL